MRVVFMGTPDFAATILEALINSQYEVVGVVSQPDRPVGRKKKLTPPAVKKLAIENDIPVFQPEKIKNDFNQVLLWEPDIIITCAYGQFIPKILLDTPPYKAINVHASLLPQYRGGAPIHQAIIDGCDKTGITIMYMDEKMDTGDIISQKEMRIDRDDTVGSLHDKLSVLGANLLLETLPQVFAETNKRLKQDEDKVTYAYNIMPEQEKIHWEKSGETIYNQIRGLNPWPGAYTLFEEKRVKLYQSQMITSQSNHKPGEIIRLDKDALVVATGDKFNLRILEVQMEGKKRQKVMDILNGNHTFEIGKKFQ